MRRRVQDVRALTLQQNGNLVELTSTGNILFETNTPGLGGQSFIIQDDGNAVLYTQAGKPVYATNTCCH